MLLSFNNFKYQIFVTIFLGFLFFHQTKNEVNSAIFIILTNIILRAIKFDNLIKKHLNKKEKFMNFDSKEEINAFTGTIGKAIPFCKDKRGKTCSKFLKSYKSLNKDLNKVLNKHGKEMNRVEAERKKKEKEEKARQARERRQRAIAARKARSRRSKKRSYKSRRRR